MRFGTAARRYSARDAPPAAPAPLSGALVVVPAGLTPDRTPERLRELSKDVRAALLLDQRGELAAVAGGPAELADGARELLAAVDRAAPAGAPEEL
jgi:hypothetical protein